MFLLGRLLRPSTYWSPYVSMFVRPSIKFSDLNEIWNVSRGRWVIHEVWCMTWSKVKVNVMHVWNVRKWPISKAICSANMQAINKLTVKCDIPRQMETISNLNSITGHIFNRWPSNLECFTFGKRILPTGSPERGLLFVLRFKIKLN